MLYVYVILYVHNLYTYVSHTAFTVRFGLGQPANHTLYTHTPYTHINARYPLPVISLFHDFVLVQAVLAVAPLLHSVCIVYMYITCVWVCILHVYGYVYYMCMGMYITWV